MSGPNALRVVAQGDREIVITRSLNAPRSLVFDAFTKPELLRKWLLGPPGWTMIVCEVDLRVGGAYRYVWKNTKGTVMGMGGVMREIGKDVGFAVAARFLRHSYAVHMLMFLREKAKEGKFEGEPLLYVRDRLGHSDVQTTLIYLEQIDRLASELVDELEDEFDQLFGLPPVSVAA